MGHKNRILEQPFQIIRNIFKSGRVGNQVIGYTGELFNERRNPSIGLQQRLPLPGHFTVPPEPDTDLGDAIVG